MLDKVHLLVIKRFNDKFLSFALAVPSDGSLRGPSLQEILSADRAVWQASTKCACPEPACVRGAPTYNPCRKRTKSGRGAAPGRPKAKAKSTASSAGANQVPAANAFDKEGQWGALGRCTDPNCPRSHLCPVPLPNGKPCAQKHIALEHLSTKH